MHLETKGWDSGVETIFIFDEAQGTYRDATLWLEFFKSIEMYSPKVYVIGFAAYGSIMTTFNLADGTLMSIPPNQRIALQAVDHKDDFPAAGILFTKNEFDGYFRKMAMNQELYLDASFLDHLFEITGGHIGAIKDVITQVEVTDVSSIACWEPTLSGPFLEIS